MRWALALGAAGALAACLARPPAGANPHPVPLRRPPVLAPSAVGELGRDLFGDPLLSSSGTLSCASCHRPDHYHEAVGATPARLTGLAAPGGVPRAVPSLRYAYRSPDFTIGPELSDIEGASAAPVAATGVTPRAAKVAGSATALPLVPVGGQFWDGRANTLQDQAMGPLFNPAEMANRDVAAVAERLRRSPYAARLAQLFGAAVLTTPARLVDEAMFAVARYEVEDSALHSYTSKYDDYLEGRARLSPAELRGLQAFDDPRRGNCAACHLDRPAPDGTPPAFTDHEYEALAVPRNTRNPVNRDPAFFDLGLCGPLRSDLAGQLSYCGMFRTPSLRNVATRAVFFHNGRYRALDSVVAFYNFRDRQPGRVYPLGPDGGVLRFDDLPRAWWGNVDTTDRPFGGGSAPALTDQEMRDIVAFLGTLTDGYVPAPRTRPGRL
jgi:cytochrome c peroxidase